MDKQSLLCHAALRASSHSFFVAHALVRFQQVRQLSDDELATWLKMVPENLALLGLCRRPNNQQELQEVSDYANCNPQQLAQVLQL